MGQAGVAVFTVAGDIIGSYFGGPIGGAIGGLAGGLIGSLIFGRSKKPLIADVQLMNSSYGNPIPILWGTARLPGTIIWMTPVQIIQGSSGSSGGGGGILGKGGPSSKATSPQVYQSAGIAFTEVIEGRIAQMVQLYLNGKLFINQVAGGPLGAELSSKQFAIRQYTGGEDQLPDFIYDQYVRSNNIPTVPANRGLAYLVFDRINIEDYGQVFPQTTAVYTTNQGNVTTVQQMAVQPAGLQATPNGYGNMGVDWTRGYIYTLVGGSLVQTSLQTGAVLASRYLGQIMTPSEIAVGQGTEVYVVGKSLDFSNYIGILMIFNPVGLASSGLIPIVQSINGGPYNGIFANFIPFTNVVVPLRTPNGYQELIVGSFAPANGGNATLLDPATGIITHAPLYFNSFFNDNVICLGLTGSQGQSQQVWILQWDGFDDPSSTLFLFRCDINYGDTELNPQLITEFAPASFGLPATPPGAVMNYDPTRDAVIIQASWAAGSSVATFAYSQAGGIIWRGSGQYLAGHAQSSSGTVGGIGGGAGQLIDTGTGAVQTSAFPDGIPGPFTPGQTFFNSAGSAVVWGISNQLFIARIAQVSLNEYPVAQILTDCCAFGGLGPADIDVSLVTQTVGGYVVRDHRSVGNALADLCHMFSIDIVESDFKIKFIPRGQPPVLGIGQDDLGSVDNNDPSKYWQPRRAQELEMPLTLNVKYEDNELGFQTGSAYAARIALPYPTTFSKRRMQMDLPTVMNNGQARAIAETLLYTMWQERNTYETAWGPKYLALDVGDNVEVVLDNGSQYFVRIQSMEISPELMMHPTLCSELPAVYLPPGTPGAVSGVPPQTVTVQPFGALLQFNVPLLQDADAVPAGTSRIYAAAGSQATPWNGGGLFISPDSVNWTLQTVVGPAAVYGYSTTVLGDFKAAFATDRKNTVTVTLAAGEAAPQSISYAEMMAGGNAALLGSEVIQFQNVTANSDGTFTLDTLTRGNRGTEWAINSHVPNELFLILIAGKLIGSRINTSAIGVKYYWELLPTGAFLDQQPPVPFTYLGYDLKPYAPVNFKRTNSGSDLQFSWIRRTRFGGDMIDGTDTVPLNEDTELYEAYLLPNAAALAAFDPNTPASYKRAWTGLTTAAALYTAAEMTTDSFTRASSPAPLVVYQLSGTVGRGFRGYQLIPAF